MTFPRIRRPFEWLPAFLLFVIAFARPMAGTEPLSSEWVDAWREDLRFLAETMPRVHPDLFHARAAGDFEADLETLAARIPDLAHHQIVVELQRIVARLEDGHTRVTLPLEPALADEFFQGHSRTPEPRDPEMEFGQLPIRLGLYPDGLRVERIDRRYREALGGRVVGIGDATVAEAMERVSETIHHDNTSGISDHLPSRLVLPEVLHALHLTPSRGAARFAIETGGGEPKVLDLHRVPRGAAVDWVDARTGVPPSYRVSRGRKFWLERLEPYGVAYLALLEIGNEEGETLADLAARFAALMAEPSVSGAIIDLRGCHGGDHSLTPPLLHAVIRAEDLDQIGNLWVLTDRSTFSAATMFAFDLEDHTSALFAGEPMSGRPNHYGDSRKILLPATGLTVRVSTLYWQHHPKDQRTTLPVDFPVETTFADYRSRRDPVVEAVLDGREAASTDLPDRLAGTWRGAMKHGRWSYPLTATFHQAAGGSWELEVEGFEPESLRVDAPDVSFDLPLDDGILRFHARLRHFGLIGRGTVNGREVSLVLRRGEALVALGDPGP